MDRADVKNTLEQKWSYTPTKNLRIWLALTMKHLSVFVELLENLLKWRRIKHAEHMKVTSVTSCWRALRPNFFDS